VNLSARTINKRLVVLHARAAETHQDAALFRVAAFTGLRLGELRALRWPRRRLLEAARSRPP
jgi:integrase